MIEPTTDDNAINHFQTIRDLLDNIEELHEDGLSSYKIAELTGFARNTIMKHW